MSSTIFLRNGGTTWAAVSSQPTGLTGGGTVAVSATGVGKIVWSPAGVGVYYTTGGGKTWTASTGIPAGARVASDRVNANKFYGFKSGTFYVSTDGGKTFTATAASGLPLTAPVRFKVIPGREGDIWLAGGSETDNAYGLWHSTDSGASFTKLANVQEADNIGFGKAATGQTYMALFSLDRRDRQQGGARSPHSKEVPNLVRSSCLIDSNSWCASWFWSLSRLRLGPRTLAI